MNAIKFKDMLTTLGEPMIPEEVDAIFGEAEVDDKGRFDYNELAKKLCEWPTF